MLAFYLSLLETQEERDKFEYLYNKYRSLLKHVAYELLHDPDMAEDAVQTAFLNIIRSVSDIDESDCQRAKRLLVIATENAAKDILRKNSHLTQVDYEQAAPSLAITPDMLDRVAVEELVTFIAALPEIYRIPLELKVFHGLNEKKIATMLNISYAAVRKRLERARNLLASVLKEE